MINIPFYDKANLTGIIKKFNISPHAKDSQNFLIKREVCQNMVNFALKTSKFSKIVEIGPGFGGITEYILKNFDQVVLIEKDSRFIDFLVNYYQDRINLNIISNNKINWQDIKGLTLIQCDILQLQFPPGALFISNLPFQISYEFIKYLACNHNFVLAILILQQDFIAHLISQPTQSHYSAISVIFQSFLLCDVKMELEKSNFYPVPEVDTAIVQIKPKHSKKSENILAQSYIVWIEKLFQFKNKSIRNAFKQLGWDSNVLDENLLNNSASDLSADQLLSIYTTHFPNF